MITHFIPSILTTAFGSFGDRGGPGGGSVTETVSLSGTLENPNEFFGSLPIQGFGESDWSSDVGFWFSSDGNLYSYDHSQGTQIYSFNEWNNTTPSQTYYIRFTDDAVSGSASPNTGDALNTWHALNTARSFRFFSDDIFGSYGNRFIQCEVEIATDSGGSNIIATGHYKALWEGGA